MLFKHFFAICCTLTIILFQPSTELLSTVTEFFPVDDKLLTNARLRAAPKLLPVQKPVKRQNTQLLAQKYSVQPIPQFRRTTLNSPRLKGLCPITAKHLSFKNKTFYRMFSISSSNEQSKFVGATGGSANYQHDKSS